jgi:hypothetical protein
MWMLLLLPLSWKLLTWAFDEPRFKQTKKHEKTDMQKALK